MRVGYFPFKPGGNPYQTLFADAIQRGGHQVTRIPPSKWFPLQKASLAKVDLLQLDWPHDWYRGKSAFTRFLKQLMYVDGLRKIKKIPVVWTAHNLVAHDSENIAFEQAMIQKLIDVTDGIIVMSERAKKQLEGMYTLPASTIVSVIPHGHYMDVYPNVVRREEARHHLAIPSDVKVALSLGRLLPYKGIEELIVGFSRANVENSLLLVAGSCTSLEYSEHLLSMARQYSSANAEIRVVASFIEDDELQYYFNAADFAVLPFKNILNSGSLLLAMSFGKCVVAPDIGSIGEVACQEGWFSYSVDSEYGLESALSRCVGVEDYRKLEDSTKRYVSEKYSWDVIGAKIDDLYSQIFRV